MIWGDVVGFPALNECTAELAFGVEAEHEVARRMTIAAMTESLDEIGATIPVSRLTLVRPKAIPWLEQRIPEHHQVALIEREGHVVRRRCVAHRLETEQVGLDREYV